LRNSALATVGASSVDGVRGKLAGGGRITRDPIVAAGFTISDLAAKPFRLVQMLLGMHSSGEAHADVGSNAR